MDNWEQDPGEILTWWKEQAKWSDELYCHLQAVKDIEYLVNMIKGLVKP